MSTFLRMSRQRARISGSEGAAVGSVPNVRYHPPERLDDQLLVTARVLEMGRACMTISQQVRLETQVGGHLRCEATIRIGRVTGTPFKPARIPQTILEAFQ